MLAFSTPGRPPSRDILDKTAREHPVSRPPMRWASQNGLPLKNITSLLALHGSQCISNADLKSGTTQSTCSLDLMTLSTGARQVRTPRHWPTSPLRSGACTPEA